MDNNIISKNEIHNGSKIDHNILNMIRTFQESNSSDGLIILQAFVHVLNPVNKHEYSDDFLQYQFDLLKRVSIVTSIPSLFELLKQLVPTSDLILSFNSIRKSMVESFLHQFRKDTHKQKWGGNGEKIHSLACLLERSFRLYSSSDIALQKTTHLWYSIVLQLFQPFIDELIEYLKNKLDKQQQYLSLCYLIKSLGYLCEQLNKIDERKDCMIVNEYCTNIILAALQQRIDFIVNKKIFEHFDSFDKLEEYKCPIRNSIFSVYPEINKLVVILNDARVPKNSTNLIEKCNDKLQTLLDKAANIFSNYPSSTSLEHCICLISSLSSIEILFHHEQFQYFLYNFCQLLLTYWQINLLHDCDAGDWSNTKAYYENTRYSVYIDTLFSHFNRLHSYIKRYCPSLLSIIIPYILLELMNFISHRYASIKISYARQNQYKTDLLAFLVHSGEYTHYFLNRTNPLEHFPLFRIDHIESKFFEYGDGILAAIILVTCPCDCLQEQLESMVHRPEKLTTEMTWLNVIRPDWFDINYQMLPQVQTFLTTKNIVQTRQNHLPIDRLVTLVIETSELDAYRSSMVHLVMKYETWQLLHLFVKHEHDWSCLSNRSTKVPEWLSTMMEYWKDFYDKCCCICANEKEIEWRLKIYQSIAAEQQFDEKFNYLKSLQQYIANIPISLYHLLCAIHEHQPQFSKRSIFAHLLYKYMVDSHMERASIYYLFLTGDEKNIYQTIERLLERQSPLFRFPHSQCHKEQTNYSDRIFDILYENLERIRLRLDIKTLDEHYNASQSYSQLFTQQQRQFAQSTENLNTKLSNGDGAFTDLNIRASKHSLHGTMQSFKIDYALVSRIKLNWAVLFPHIIVRLKPSIIYHFVTLRFEFQETSSSSLTDPERIAVGNLIELLSSFLNEKK